MEVKQPSISIVGVDQSQTHQSSGPHKAIYTIYLKLNEMPPESWGRFFEEARRFPRHSMWRKAWCDGDYVVIECPPEELEEHHLECLKEDVATANKDWWEAAKKYQRQIEAERAEEDAEKERVSNVLGNIKF
ncbi:MAG: hypothetical protein AAF750_09240 [Planctomycetota bacterium]